METLLGIFCKHPIAGKVKTRLGKDIGNESAARLYETFLADIVDRLRGTADARVLHYAPNNAAAREYFDELSGGDYSVQPQVEGNLGDRLAAFFDDAFADGANQVIVIGSDSPTVSPNDVDQAVATLDRHDAVLGAADDGGYYLIGLRRIVPGLFADIDWSTATVYDQQQQRIVDNDLTVQRLPPIPEVDTLNDVVKLLAHPNLAQCARTRTLLNQLDLP